MASITFTYNDGATVKTIALQKWRIFRRSVRFRYNYLNGGTESNHRATQLIFELEWESLLPVEYADVIAIIDQIRSGLSVFITGVSEISYFKAAAIPPGGLEVDLDADEFDESSGEYFEKMPFKVAFISKTKRGLTSDS